MSSMPGHEECVSNAWQMVTCDRCGTTYQCTPSSDFYCAAEGDHCCEPCLLGGRSIDEVWGIQPLDEVVTVQDPFPHYEQGA